MKKILLATAMIAASTGYAAAEVTLSGDARMGIVSDGSDMMFSSRARVKFTLSGESDGGVAFGASFRANNAADAANGQAGSVYVSGAFGKLEMGSNDSAVQAAVGQVSGVGFTGLGDMNEVSHIGSEGPSNILYTYSAGAVAVMVGAGQIDSDDFSVAAKYSTDAYNVALGWATDGSGFLDADEIALAVGGTFGAAAVKAVFTDRSDTGSEYAVSATGTFGAAAVTVFYRDSETRDSAYGLGGCYDMGGGLSVVGGIAQKDDGSDAVADLGLTMSF